jgi:hypothetical protein
VSGGLKISSREARVRYANIPAGINDIDIRFHSGVVAVGVPMFSGSSYT